MSEYRVASRYAKSLIELSKEKGLLEQVKDDMLAFTKAFKESRDLQLMLQSPLISHLRKGAILHQIFEGKFNELTITFIDIVCKKARESVLDNVAVEFVNQYNIVKGIQRAKITSSFALPSEMSAQVIAIIKEETGKEIELEEVVDETLIGGFILQIGDKQIDDSIKGRLEDLRSEMLA